MIISESKYTWCGIDLYQKTENNLTNFFVNNKEVSLWRFEVDSNNKKTLIIIEL